MLEKIVGEYLKLFPDDKNSLALLLKQITGGENLSDRRNYTGHVTGSSLIFSPDYKKLLLIYHPTFERWQQPGGHWDPDEEGPWLTAEREAVEETGIKIAKRLYMPDKRVPVLIESHPVPTKPPKNEPLHYHHAFWYSFLAASEEDRKSTRL